MADKLCVLIGKSPWGGSLRLLVRQRLSMRLWIISREGGGVFLVVGYPGFWVGGGGMEGMERGLGRGGGGVVGGERGKKVCKGAQRGELVRHCGSGMSK